MADSQQLDASASDADLMRRHLAGDRQAFPALVERYRSELFNFLARFTGDAHLAEDVFQEAFLQLHVSAALYDPARRLKPWLFTIAANKARDAMRGRTRHSAASLDATVDAAEEGATYAEMMPSDVPAPEEFLANLDTRSAVQEIVSEMPEALRIALLLCYFHEMSYQEIAEVLDAPLGTIKSRIHTAVKLFAQRWKAAARRLGYDTDKRG